MNKVFLLRHGENLANITSELSYLKVDYSLTTKGKLQAYQTAAYFRDKAIQLIYTSPLKRAVETAQIIGEELGIEPVIIENLREFNVGFLEGMSDRDESWRIHNETIRAWVQGKPEARFPGGDDFGAVNTQMQAAMHEILAGNDGRRILVIGHGGLFFTSISGLCQNTTLQEISGRISNNCSISEMDLELKDGVIRGKLLRWADDSHLYGEAADFVRGYLT